MVGLVHAVSALESKVDAGGGNYRQRVFDAFPPFPGTIRITDLYALFPSWSSRVFEVALRDLRAMGKVERVSLGVYRLTGERVDRPEDRRGRPPRMKP